MIRSYLLVVINSVVVATFTVSLVTFFINGPTFIANQPTPSPSCIDPSSFDHFPAPPNLSCISLSEISANTDNILIYSAWQNLSFYFVINSCLLCLFILLHDFKVLNGKGHTIWTVKKASHGFSSVLYSPIVFFWNFNHGNFVSFLCKFIAIIISPCSPSCSIGILNYSFFHYYITISNIFYQLPFSPSMPTRTITGISGCRAIFCIWTGCKCGTKRLAQYELLLLVSFFYYFVHF